MRGKSHLPCISKKNTLLLRLKTMARVLQKVREIISLSPIFQLNQEVPDWGWPSVKKLLKPMTAVFPLPPLKEKEPPLLLNYPSTANKTSRFQTFTSN